MTMTPVPVKQSAPALARAPDSWRSLRNEMDRLFDQFAAGFGIGRFPSFKSSNLDSLPDPAVDITEDDAAFKLTAELPGMTEKDVQVSLSGNTLVIKGEKRQEREEKKRDYHLTERSYGEFQRLFTLPDSVEGDKLTASFANGVLTVEAPKAAKAAPKQIEVKAGA